MSNKYIAALDIGTTTVKCYIYDNFANTIGKSTAQVELLYHQPGYVEIQPEQLWESIVTAMKSAIIDSGLSVDQIQCLGISSQRCTFVTWNKTTGQCYHNFITWKDLRADSLVKELNNSYLFKGIKAASKCIYTVSRSKRFLAGSALKFMNPQVSVRLMWVLKNVDGITKAIENGDVQMGTVDTWALNRLTKGKINVSDYSCASATGLFDPYTLCWAGWGLKMLGIPESILPKIVDTAGPTHFGTMDESILGAPIPITASVADQSAAVFGSRCFNAGDLKITLGTGTFLDVNTGSQVHASVEGLYPVIGWKYKEELIYLAEVGSNDTGALTKWVVDSGLVKEIGDSADVAKSVDDNGGVYFVPAFSGLQAPIHDSCAGSGFIGVQPTSKKAHLLRAILESIAYRVAQLYNIFTKELNCTSNRIKVDGGVSQNDFLAQFLADLTNVTIVRNESSEMSVLGAAYLAGLASGIWKDKQEILNIKTVTHEFKSQKEINEKYQLSFQNWCQAVQRFCGWYSKIDNNRNFKC